MNDSGGAHKKREHAVPWPGARGETTVREPSRFHPAIHVAAGGAAAASSDWRDPFERLGGFLRRLFAGREPRRLRLCETLSLGNRGYVAVVRYRQQQFLVGGTSNSVALLARLEECRCGETSCEHE